MSIYQGIRSLLTSLPLLIIVYHSLMVDSTDSLSTNESGCGKDEYKHEDWCCIKCDLGTHLVQDCEKGGDTKCDGCKSGEFMDEKNHLTECRRCTNCDSSEGKEITTNCSRTHNTECKCKENSYELNKHCLNCKSCNDETEEIVQECSAMNDTVCRIKAKNNSSTGMVAAVVVGIIVLVGVGLVVYWYKKRCNKMTLFPLTDIDLTSEQLMDMGELIEPKQYHKIGLKLGLTEATLQQIATDYQNNSKEQGYRILLQWMEMHGKRRAFPDLIDTLRGAELKNIAENIIQKIVGNRTEVPEGCVGNPEDCENGGMTCSTTGHR
uniref:Tumor necrosis factor receptor superfamily member 6 n=1 Tax=Callorhinchus milii TaxID=7868 RepID=A0A4W3K4A1_CALMI